MDRIIMRTQLALAAVILAATATTASAQSAGQNYVQFTLGSGVAGNLDLFADDGTDTFSEDADLEAGIFGSVAAGTKLTAYPVRIEAEFVATENDVDETEDFGEVTASSQSIFLNAIYDFQAGGFTPYVGAGVGYGRVGFESEGDEQNDRGFVWQVRAGVNYALSERTTIDFGYRYLTLPEFERAESGLEVSAEGEVHTLSVGARFSF